MKARAWLVLLAVASIGATAFVASSWVQRDAARGTTRGESAELARATTRELSEVATQSDDAHGAASSEQRSRAASALTGRVIDDASGVGLAGFWARAWNAGEFAGDASSDANGYFQLPAPTLDDSGRCSCRVRVNAPWGWTLLSAAADPRPRDDGAFDELVFRARPARFGPVRAKLVDYDTREPVPDYMLRIATEDGSREQVVSDSAGVFTSERDYAEGLLRLLFHDFETSAQGSNEERLCYHFELAFDPAVPEPPVIAIPVGPTYRLELDAPPDVLRQLLFSELRPSQADESLRVIRAEAQVRGRESRWVRFRPHYARPDPLVAPWKLAIASTDGLWFGDAPVQSLRGIHPTPIAITLTARSQVLGRLRDRQGDPIGQANVSLDALGEATLRATTISSGNGLFAFELVPAGRYVVTAISTMHAITSTEVVVRGGERTEIELVLDAAQIAGAVSGVVIASKDPRRHPAPTIVLSSNNPTGRWIEQPTQWRREGEQWLADFRVEDVPAGDYEVVLSGYDVEEYTPDTLRISPPADGLRFVQLETICIAFEAADARDARQLEACRAVLLSGGCRDWPETFEREWGHCLSHAGQLDDDARWIVAAEGYAPHWGSRDELEPRTRGFLARASLERGWGLEIDARGPGYAKLAGVEVRLDDDLAGSTGADGTLRIVRERRPQRVDVRFRDWRVDPSSLSMLRRALQNGDPRCVVQMSP